MAVGAKSRHFPSDRFEVTQSDILSSCLGRPTCSGILGIAIIIGCRLIIGCLVIVAISVNATFAQQDYDSLECSLIGFGVDLPSSFRHERQTHRR